MLLIELLYFLSSFLLAIYGFNAAFHAWRYWRHGLARYIVGNATTQPNLRAAEPTSFPMVTVQLPIYNERHVAARLLESILAQEWPADRLHVQILDDSTDDTTQIIAQAIAAYRTRAQSCPIQIEHIHRSERRGYKAGALQHGLATARGEFIAIFDADFVPPSDFLRRAMRAAADPRVGCVQARWGHLNRGHSLLTRAQSLGVDGHFMVEQTVRAHLDTFLNFNGSAGIWRRACIEQAGGWQGDTLTEDLDLSYRAQLCGWRIAYLPDLVVPAELPVQVEAFKRQQFRWAKGSLQTATKLMGRLWTSSEPLWRKALSTLHLTNYAVHPLMLANLLLLWPILFCQCLLLYLSPLLTVAAAGPPLLYWVAWTPETGPRWEHLRLLLMLVALGTGLSLSNSRAAWEALANIQSEFKRTPKFAITTAYTRWQASDYALRTSALIWLEFALALYACGLLIYTLSIGIWWVSFWVLLYASGFGMVAGLALWQAKQINRAHHNMTHQLQPTYTTSSTLAPVPGGEIHGTSSSS